MAGADIRRFSTEERNWAGNVGAGQIANGLLGFAGAVLSPVIVLPVFVGQLDPSPYVVAAVAVVAGVCWNLPWLAGGELRAARRQMPWLLAFAVLRLATIMILALVIDRLDLSSDAQVLRAFFVCFAVYTLAASLATGLWGSMTARAVPAAHRRAFSATSVVTASLGAVVAGLIVARVLGDEGPAFPDDFALLFVTTAACLTAAAFFQSRVREPARSASRPLPRRATIGNRSGVGRFMAFRASLAVAAFVDPFLVVFALSELSAPVRFAGWYLVAYALSRLAFAPAWSAGAQRFGLRPAFQVVALLRLVLPTACLLVPVIVDQGFWTDRFTGDDAGARLFVVAFILLGAIHAGQSQLNPPFAIEMAAGRPVAAHLRPLNAALMLAAAAPFAGAWLLDTYDWDRLFIAGAVTGLVAILLGGLVPAPAARPRPVPGAWNLRRARP